ncbi:MAG: YggS family pyridoxal phosphate-dependent enzyme [Planctomycetota bacterium]|nr:YggS family pyridoxal phosphate-dependent enzyme [Planctomycetota bacterium]
MAERLPSIEPERIARNLAEVRARIGAAAARAGRDAAGVRLIAVTKYVGAAEVRALLAGGVRDLGENRIQDAREKLEALRGEVAAAGARWHFIGHLQTNKVKYALRDYAWLGAVDSSRLLREIAREARKRGLAEVPCLAEVNVSGEAQKHGLAPGELRGFLGEAAACAPCRVAGLMAMAPHGDDAERVARPVFARLRALLEEANAQGWAPAPLLELSMGMTQDYEAAVEEGATMVRVGSALFA